MRSMQKALLVIFVYSSNLFSMYDNPLERKYNQAKSMVDSVVFRIKYNKQYIVGAVAASLGTYVSPKYTALVSGLVASALAVQGRYQLWKLQHKYQQFEREEREWSLGYKAHTHLLARWRQNNQFGDGWYWPSAFYMKEDFGSVKNTFLLDIRAGRIEIFNSEEQLIKEPLPSDVIVAIKHEMNVILHDLEIVSQYTDIYKAYAQPEEFVPDTGYTQILWPNYNCASGLFVELDQMFKRLEILRDVVSFIQTEVGGDGWPQW